MPQSQEQQQEQQLPPRIPIVHNAALAGTVLIPLVMLLPPRRMDIRFFVLAGTLSLATNQLCYEYTGQSIYSRFSSRMSSIITPGLPEKAQRTQRLIREQREREAAAAVSGAKTTGPRAGGQDGRSIGDAVKKVWMGGEGEDWNEKRELEHRKALEEGKGLSGIIYDQIAEVLGGKATSNGDRNGDNETDALRAEPKSSKKQ